MNLQSMKNVYRNRGRLILIVALLSVSLMFVASMTSLSANSQQELATIHQLVGATITVKYPSNDATPVSTIGSSGGGGQSFGNTPTPLPNSVVSAVKKVPGVVSTQESLSRGDSGDALQGATISSPNGQSFHAPLSVYGIESDSTSFTLTSGITPTFVSGRRFQASDATADVAQVSQTVAQANQLSVGSTFTLKGTTFTVIGLYTTSNQLANSTVVIPLTTMQKVFQVNGVDSITATAASYDQVEPVAARLRLALGPQLDVTTQTAKYSQVFSALQVAQESIQVALVIAIAVAVLVTIFAVLQLVREQTSEIAILKALGTSHLQVLWQFWGEILTFSVTAAALATFLLVTLGPFLAQRFDINAASLVQNQTGRAAGGLFLSVGGVSASTVSNPLSTVHLAAATLNPQTLFIIVGIGLGLALLTSLIPTWYVSTLKPAQVLRQAN
jgi:putative ABC transport system permease protein